MNSVRNSESSRTKCWLMLDRSHETSMLKGRVNKARDDDHCAVLLVKQSKPGCNPTRLHTTVQTTRNDVFRDCRAALQFTMSHSLRAQPGLRDRLLAFCVVYMLYTYNAKGTQDLQNLMANTNRKGDAAPDYKEQQVNLFLEAHRSELKTYKRHYL